jgi:hypothetical protein
MSEEKSKRPQALNVELPRDLEPIYANFALISHTASELIIDLAQMLPNQPGAQVKSRVVMTPLNAKLLLRALKDNLGKYEASFGEIQIPGEADGLAQAFFGHVKPPETE